MATDALGGVLGSSAYELIRGALSSATSDGGAWQATREAVGRAVEGGEVMLVVLTRRDQPPAQAGELPAIVAPAARLAAPEAALEYRDLVLDPGERAARRGERAIDLTVTEFRLLEFLLRHPRQVLTRNVIFDRVWGFDLTATSNTLNVYIGY